MTDFKPDSHDALPPHWANREVLFEVITVGNAVKVIAIDAITGIETSIVGSPTMTAYSLKMNAMRKLISMLMKIEQGDDPAPQTPRKPGRYA
ncbi:MAG: hypothetical protein SFV19_11240 [Rhodospirillaceae bacterium]|nr:hypothetical protein [Rhodospirillaceae bacterium]